MTLSLEFSSDSETVGIGHEVPQALQHGQVDWPIALPLRLKGRKAVFELLRESLVAKLLTLRQSLQELARSPAAVEPASAGLVFLLFCLAAFHSSFQPRGAPATSYTLMDLLLASNALSRGSFVVAMVAVGT